LSSVTSIFCGSRDGRRNKKARFGIESSGGWRVTLPPPGNLLKSGLVRASRDQAAEADLRDFIRPFDSMKSDMRGAISARKREPLNTP